MKYTIISRNLDNIANIKIKNFSFEQLEDFKYLEVNVNHKNNMHSGVRKKINAANHAYFAMNKNA